MTISFKGAHFPSGAAEPFQDLVYLPNAGRVDTTFVDDDLFGNSVCRQRFGKELGCRRSISSLR